MSDCVVRLKPLQYVQIHDNNTSVAFIECGPKTITLSSHQQLLTKDPQPFVCVGPEEYAVVENPVLKDKEGGIVLDKHGQAKIRLGEKEVRLNQEPFPLYPKETVVKVERLVVLAANQALVLKVNQDFVETNGLKRVAGDEYLFRGPATYVPKVQEDILERRNAQVVRFNEVMRLKAINKHTNEEGVTRTVGEEYLVTQPGDYMIGVDEKLVAFIKCRVLTERVAVHIECIKAFVDTRPWAKGKERKPGEKYLVTYHDTAEFVPLPSEKFVAEVPLLAVGKKQWAVILDPVGPDGNQRLGTRKVITDTRVFLQPGEKLEEHGVKPIYVLGDDEALLLTAVEEFEDTSVTPSVSRVSGEQWLLQGPTEYIPNSCVRILKDAHTGSEKRKRYVLSEGEGIYVRDIYSGEVRAVTNCTYMLEAHEELWEKNLPPVVEERLAHQGESHASYMEKGKGGLRKRDKTRLVRFSIPHNAVTQIYDYQQRTQRTVFGPDAVCLGPEEEFTILNLSGSPWDPTRPNVCLPKQTGFIKSLYLFLGPSSLSDVVNVETSDHARLQLQLSYDWHFDVEAGNSEQANECFNVPDFVGDCCSCIASRVRASIASIPFKKFHTHSSTIVKGAVFGYEKDGTTPKSSMYFNSNRLVVTSVDIQEIDVVDKKTKEALQQSVKMAIEITTQSQEAQARQGAQVQEQQARGRLDRQQIADRSANEVVRKELLEYETQSAAIASTGRAKAEARARATAAEIEGDCSVTVARTKAQTNMQLDSVQLELRKKRDTTTLDHQGQLDTAEIMYQKQMAEIESNKFKQTMDAVGTKTVQEISRSGPEMQAKLLKGLGLEGYLVTDGTNPINLFNTAKGMTAQPGHQDPNAAK